MTSLDKAKAFSKLKRTALIILPLAAAAIQAHAGVILSYTSGGFNFSSGASISSGGTLNSSGLPSVNGITGLTFWGNGTYQAFSGGSSSGACSSICGGAWAEGTASGLPYPSDLLINYDFTVSDSNNLPIAWSLFGEVYTPDSVYETVSGTTANGGGTVTGSLDIPSTGLSESWWYFSLNVDFVGSYNSGDTLTLNIPGAASIDLTGAAASAPEPGTFALLGAGGILLGVLRRRRRSA